MIMMNYGVIIIPNWICDLQAYTLNGMIFLLSVYVSYQLSKELHRDIFDEE